MTGGRAALSALGRLACLVSCCAAAAAWAGSTAAGSTRGPAFDEPSEAAVACHGVKVCKPAELHKDAKQREAGAVLTCSDPVALPGMPVELKLHEAPPSSGAGACEVRERKAVPESSRRGDGACGVCEPAELHEDAAMPRAHRSRKSAEPCKAVAACDVGKPAVDAPGGVAVAYEVCKPAKPHEVAAAAQSSGAAVCEACAPAEPCTAAAVALSSSDAVPREAAVESSSAAAA